MWIRGGIWFECGSCLGEQLLLKSDVVAKKLERQNENRQRQVRRQYSVAAPCGLRSGLRQSGRPLCVWFNVRAKARAYLRCDGNSNSNSKSNDKGEYRDSSLRSE
jgi:hypothetical protein